MKKLIIVSVMLCAVCINMCMANPTAGQTSDECNIQAMLSNADDAQWLLPQCVFVLAYQEKHGKLNQAQRLQLKKVLAPAMQKVRIAYNTLGANKKQKESEKFIKLQKAFSLFADSKGTYGITWAPYYWEIADDDRVDAVLSEVLVAAAAPRSLLTPNPELRANLPQNAEGEKIVPAVDLAHLESVFSFDKDTRLEEKDFLIDVKVLNKILKNGGDFSPLLNFMAEQGSFNPKDSNYIPPRFVRLVLTYHAESLAPADKAKLLAYVKNSSYSTGFRFLAGTVAANYAFNKAIPKEYQGKFRYSPPEANLIVDALNLRGDLSAADEARVLRLIRRVNPSAANKKDSKDKSSVKSQAMAGAAVPVAIGIEQAFGSTVLDAVLAAGSSALESGVASIHSTMLSIGSIAVLLEPGTALLPMGIFGYALSDALSPIYRRNFQKALEQATYVEVPDKYITKSMAAKTPGYVMGKGVIRFLAAKATELSLQQTATAAAPSVPQAGSGLEQLRPALDTFGESLVLGAVVWDKYTMARVGESAQTKSRAESKTKEEPTCLYDDMIGQYNASTKLFLIGAQLNPGDAFTLEAAKLLHSCLVERNYCSPLTDIQKKAGVGAWFLNCKNTQLSKVKVKATCPIDVRELDRVLKQIYSFRDNKGRPLYTRALYYMGRWIAEAELGIVVVNEPLEDILASWLKETIMPNGKLHPTRDPEIIKPSFIYRNGAHEKAARYRFQDGEKKYHHFHYEGIMPYVYTHNKQRYRSFFKCNRSILYVPKIPKIFN